MDLRRVENNYQLRRDVLWDWKDCKYALLSTVNRNDSFYSYDDAYNANTGWCPIIGREFYSFNGTNQYITSGFNADSCIGDGNDFTISMWLRPYDSGDTAIDVFIGGHDLNRFFLGFFQSNKYLAVALGDTYIFPNFYQLTMEEWCHLAVKRVGSDVITAINGSIISTDVYSGTDNYSEYFSIGCGTNAGGRGFYTPCDIADVMIFNTPISNEAISALGQKTFRPIEPVSSIKNFFINPVPIPFELDSVFNIEMLQFLQQDGTIPILWEGLGHPRGYWTLNYRGNITRG